MKWLDSNRMRLVLVGFVTAIVFDGGSASADFTWTQKADMPTPRMTHTSAVVNGKIYVIGGVSSEPGWKPLSTVEEYDPITNTWTRKTDMPTARGDFVGSSAVVDGKIYVIGSSDFTDPDVWAGPTVEEYDPSTDTWTRKADMPTSRWSLGTCAVGGKIYAIGGAPNSYTGLNVVEQYDPTTDTWTRKANMPTGVWGACACVVDGKIYALGGRPGSTAVPTVQEYDPATDTWTRKADMLLGTSQMASVVLGDKIVVIGGWHHSGRFPYTTVQMYDPATDIWTKEADVPFLRAFVTGEVVNNRIYVIGGTDRPHPCPAFSTVYEFGPLLDFNWDGIVDSEDMCILVDNWNTDSPLCDIAPPPFGDGIVDVQDLIALAEHLFEEIFPVELIGLWKLDEEEGGIAYNSIGDNHGILNGNPAWQPNSGQVAGALEFDGIDDYVSISSFMSTANSSLSVFAWIKGGMPGQVIFSQKGRSDWLLADTTEGSLMTELKFLGMSGVPLYSHAVITDGNWHRVGLVWDGSNRILYVDDVEVVSDTCDKGRLFGVLQIGAGMNLDPGSFWSGLIDDVRIYNRAVTP